MELSKQLSNIPAKSLLEMKLSQEMNAFSHLPGEQALKAWFESMKGDIYSESKQAAEKLYDMLPRNIEDVKKTLKSMYSSAIKDTLQGDFKDEIPKFFALGIALNKYGHQTQDHRMKENAKTIFEGCLYAQNNLC